MSAPVMSGLTYDDLAELPQDDHLRRELIDGELFVSPSPIVRHQRAVLRVASALLAQSDERGGMALLGPIDVVFSPQTAVVPDVAFIGPDRVSELHDGRFVDIVPDLLVEVSSPSTRRLDLVKKRALYEREGVPEFWFVDLDADLIDVHRLGQGGAYGTPGTLDEDAVLTCLAAPGFELSVLEALSR